MNADLEITEATVEDAGAIAALVNSGYRGEYSRQGWTHEDNLLDGTRIDEKGVTNLIARPGTVVLKCLREGKILGCVDRKSTRLNSSYT